MLNAVVCRKPEKQTRCTSSLSSVSICFGRCQEGAVEKLLHGDAIVAARGGVSWWWSFTAAPLAPPICIEIPNFVKRVQPRYCTESPTIYYTSQIPTLLSYIVFTPTAELFIDTHV